VGFGLKPPNLRSIVSVSSKFPRERAFVLSDAKPFGSDGRLDS
jgi:hypothetical protein